MTDQFNSFKRRRFLGASAVVAALFLAGCGGSDPLGSSSEPGATESAGGTAGTVTVGSAGFAESEIIAELYAISLEDAGFQVERRMQIGAREAYFQALQDGSIDLIPEYTGNLLQFLDPESDASDPDAILTDLQAALPENMRVLTPSPAEDKDSWVVTAEWSQANNVTSLDQLAGLDTQLSLAGNPELAERPYGPPGLTEFYGVPADDMDFIPIDDGGGPLTVQGLTSGEFDMANVFSTSPAILENNLVVLEDPKHMIVPQNVIPLLSDTVPTSADEVLDTVSAALTTETLIEMNAQNQGDEKAAPAAIARQWLEDQGLIS